MQALVIRERILGPAHPDTSYYIRYRGAIYADGGQFDRCIELWNYALDMQQHMLDPLDPMTQSSLFSFTELFSFMMDKQTGTGCRVPPVQRGDLIRVFNKAVSLEPFDRLVRLFARKTNDNAVAGVRSKTRETIVGRCTSLRAGRDVFEQGPCGHFAPGLLTHAGYSRRRHRRAQSIA